MGIIAGNGIVICGNFSKLSTKKPKNWWNKDWKILRPYFFKWREKIGKVECDCKEVEEHYQPYYGSTFFHSEECALIKQLEEKPQLKNLWAYQHLPALPIDYDNC